MTRFVPAKGLIRWLISIKARKNFKENFKEIIQNKIEKSNSIVINKIPYKTKLIYTRIKLLDSSVKKLP